MQVNTGGQRCPGSPRCVARRNERIGLSGRGHIEIRLPEAVARRQTERKSLSSRERASIRRELRRANANVLGISAPPNRKQQRSPSCGDRLGILVLRLLRRLRLLLL